MTSIYTISREDMYDYRRCPKIAAIKAYKALRAIQEGKTTEPASQPRPLEPAIIGSIGEAAVRLGFSGIPVSAAMEQISAKIPQINLNQFLKQIAVDSLSGVERIRKELAAKYGDIEIIGKGEGRNPDLAGTVRPDYVALERNSDEPIIVETKDTTRQNPTDKFQAMFYNGVAEKYGVYLMEERVENGKTVLAPRMMRSKAQTILVYPRLAQYFIVDEKFVPDLRMIKDVWEAKQLGLKGLTPRTECNRKCSHHRLKTNLPEGAMEPLPPPPLLFSQGMIESGYNLNTHYQTNYAWKLLPVAARLAIVLGRLDESRINLLKEWLTDTAGLDHAAVDLITDANKREDFLKSKPDAEKLLKYLRDELEPWKEILKKRLEISSPSILGRATSVYSLPEGSSTFVKDARRRWK